MIDKELYSKIKKNIDNLAKPLDSLGVFEEIIPRIGCILQDETVDLGRVALLVFCSDNGIIEEGVSQSDESVTKAIATLLGQKKSSVCHMARVNNVDVFPFNIGIKIPEKIEGVDDSYFISHGTRNFYRENMAMDIDKCEQAVENGRKIVRDLYGKGYKTFLLGEMGIGNTTTATAIICGSLLLDPKEICGRGAGLDSGGLLIKQSVIRASLDKYVGALFDPINMMASYGGYDIACMYGAILECYELHCPVILDGLITAAAALLAYRQDEKYGEVLIFSHQGREKGIQEVMSFMNQKVILNDDMALGEGTGAVMFYALLRTALSVYHGKTTFECAEIEPYERLK